jgi:hypothetical protein
MSLLWVTIQPGYDETHLMLTDGQVGAAMRARLPSVPVQAGSLAALLTALSGWYGRSLTAVVDAGDRDGARHPERWQQLLGEIDSEQVKVEWVVVPTAWERDRFLGEVDGDWRAARRLLTFAATGLR